MFLFNYLIVFKIIAYDPIGVIIPSIIIFVCIYGIDRHIKRSWSGSKTTSGYIRRC